MKRDWRINLAGSLVAVPPIMLFPLTWGALNDPSVILGSWDLFLLFYGLPFTAAAALWFYVQRSKNSA